MRFCADLHIHSVLSPCGNLDMAPRDIVRTAYEKGVNLIAITDHNTAAHAPVVSELVKEYGMHALYGMELQTTSETHALCLFDSVDNALEFSDYIYPLLPNIPANPDIFGDQVVVDADNMIVRMEDKLLLQSAEIEIEEAIEVVHSMGGMLFAAHINRDTFSIISQLGFIREGLALDGIEFSRHITVSQGCELYPEYCAHYPALHNSDAHFLEDIGKAVTVFEMEHPTLEELYKALHGLEGRAVSYDA